MIKNKDTIEELIRRRANALYEICNMLSAKKYGYTIIINNLINVPQFSGYFFQKGLQPSIIQKIIYEIQNDNKIRMTNLSYDDVYNISSYAEITIESANKKISFSYIESIKTTN